MSEKTQRKPRICQVCGATLFLTASGIKDHAATCEGKKA
jgi:hypothetical protein